MPPKRKPKHTLPQAHIEIHQISYKCPKCEQINTRDVTIVLSPKSKDLASQVAGWCSYRYCEAQHNIKYSLRRRKDNSLKLKIIEFLCNKESVNKRFTILA